MKKEINWGIIGLGKIAKKFAEGLSKVENATLYGVASRDLGKAKEFSEEYQSEVAYGSYEELMQDENIDVIYIATPHVFHHTLTLDCLKHGKAVLSEKPFAMNLKEAEEMIHAARDNKVFLMEALWTKFLPHFQDVIQKVNSEEFGKIRSLKADFGFKAEFDKKKRLFNKSLGGGSLLDIGVYPIFAAYCLLGKPEKIEAEAKFAETGVDLETRMKFKYKNDVVAELHATFKEKTPTVAEITLEKATIILDSRFHEPTSVTTITEDKQETRDFGVENNGYTFEAEHVTKDAFRKERQKAISGVIKTLWILWLY